PFEKVDLNEAAYRRIFMGARLGRNDQKFYVNPRKEPQALQSLFPGYDQLSGDRNLWLNYFTREAEVKVTSAMYSARYEFGAVLYHSFAGCFDIVRRYGADILILGASDVGQSMPPDELAKSYPGQKILMCASPLMTLHGMEKAIELIEDLYPPEILRPRKIIVGVNRTMSYVASPFYPGLNEAKLLEIQKYKQSDLLGRYAFLNHSLRLPWTWQRIYPIRKDANQLPLVNRVDHPERWSIIDIKVTREEYLADPEAFERRRRLNRQTSSIFMGADHNLDCQGLDEFPKILGRVKEKALGLADTVTFYTTPTMGEELREAPPCYLALFQRTIAALEDDRTLVLHGSMEDYGLTPWDFAFKESRRDGGYLAFDVAHTNYFGAKKMVAQLTKRMRERWDR
ncbi:MAG: hypothetical protein AB7F86_20505, partial [Bdellovibrionales bacterium]